MLIDGITLLDTSTVSNLSIVAGSTLPAVGNNLGELFFKTAPNEGLYVYDGLNWTFVSADPALVSHAADQTVHITPAQNALIDAITASALELNRTVGVTSPIQPQIDSKLNLAGGSMGGSITMPAGTHISIADAPSSALHATNKAYVDAYASGLVWQNPILDPDLMSDNLSVAPSTTTSQIYIVGAVTTSASADVLVPIKLVAAGYARVAANLS